MDMQVSASAALDDEPVLDDVRLDQMRRWHGTDETNLPPAGTLKNLARDTVAAIEELRRARATIAALRAAMGEAFWVTDFRTLHEILLTALGPPPPGRE
jgi:hypothetical protein